MSRWREAGETVLEAAQKMVAKGLAVGTSGNISLRLPADGENQMMAITPTSRHYDTLKVDEIPIIDFERKIIEGSLSPSIEAPLHIGIYRAREDVNAIIHTHSVFASAIAVAGLEIPPLLEDQVAVLGGEIKLAGYAPSGSAEQVNTAVKALGNRNAVLLANHGAVGTGRTMRDAFTAGELIEATAKVYFLTLTIEKVNQLPEEAVVSLKELYTKLKTREE